MTQVYSRAELSKPTSKPSGKAPKRRIMKMILKTEDPKKLDFFPDDKWILNFIKTEYKTNPDFKSRMRRFGRKLAAPILATGGILGGVAGLTTLGILSGGMTVPAAVIWGGFVAATTYFIVDTAIRDVKSAFTYFGETVLDDDFKKKIGMTFAKSKGQNLKQSFKKGFQDLMTRVREAAEPKAAADLQPVSERTSLRGQLKNVFEVVSDSYADTPKASAPAHQKAKPAIKP